MQKILIIDMYSSKSIFAIFKKRYKRALAGQAKLVFRRWDDVQGIQEVCKTQPDGIIITGSDYFVNGKVKATVPRFVLKAGIPILGICYGFQYIARLFGKNNYVKSFDQGYRRYIREYGIKEPFHVPKLKYYFNHTDYVVRVPRGLKEAIIDSGRVNMAYDARRKYIGIQFHPERYAKSGRIFFAEWLKYIS